LPFEESFPQAAVYEYAVLVTSLGDEHYRDRADAENGFDELKNQWGWGGFTTQDLARCQITARIVAQVYIWWSIFLRLAFPGKHLEGISSCPLLLYAIGKQTQHSGQTKSVVQRARTWLKAAIEEAIDQDFLVKNPARKLEMPVTRNTCKRYLSSEEVQKLLMSLEGRDRLIARMLNVCALRPGELFALRWRSVQQGRLKIEEAVYRGKVGPTKTEGSAAFVAIPGSLQKELEFWREKCRYPGDDQIVFPSRRGGPLESHNYLRRVLKSKGKEAGIEDITFQALRRTFATQVRGIGTVKDAQTQLRHSNATTTMNVYTQEIPASVKATVEALDQRLFGVLNTIEHEFKM